MANWTDIKKKAQNGANRLQEIIAHPNVVTATKVVNAAVNVAAQIGQAHLNGPVAIVGAAGAILDQVRDSLGIAKHDPVEDWVNHPPTDITSHSSAFPGIIVKHGLLNLLKTRVVATSNNSSLVAISHEDEIMVLRLWTSADNKFKADPVVWRTEGFPFSILSDVMWQTLDGRIVRISNTSPSDNLGDTIVVSERYDDIPYIGIHSVEDFNSTIKIYHSKGISRGALLHGPPGTGKTSFVRAYARHTDKTLLIVPPSVMAQRQDIEMFVDMLLPDILLFDDIDRAPNGLVAAMSLVEDLRRKYPLMVIFSTCNNLDQTNAALLRPGRLGERLAFNAPPRDDKKAVLRLYLQRYGVATKTPLEIDELVDAMEHDGFSHDYVRFVAEQAVVMDRERLLRCVADLNVHLDLAYCIEPPLAPPSWAPGQRLRNLAKKGRPT